MAASTFGAETEEWDWEADCWNQAPVAWMQHRHNNNTLPPDHNAITQPTALSKHLLDRPLLYVDMDEHHQQLAAEEQQDAKPKVKGVRGRPLRKQTHETTPGFNNQLHKELRAACGPPVSNEVIERYLNAQSRTSSPDSTSLPDLNFTDNASHTSSSTNFVSCSGSNSDLNPDVPEFVPILPEPKHSRSNSRTFLKQRDKTSYANNLRGNAYAKRQNKFNIDDKKDFPALK